MRRRGTPVLLAVGIALCAPAALAEETPSVMTRFTLMVGFPTGEPTASAGVLLVPGTVIPFAAADAGDAARQEAVDRSVPFTETVDRLWSTFRLDPARMYQTGGSWPTPLGQRLEVIALKRAGLSVAATLLGFNDAIATYRVVFQLQDGKVLADSTVSVKRGGRAVVGGMNGEAAPYFFLFVEPDPAKVDGAIPHFDESAGLTEPVVVTKPMPKYPEEARKARVTGIVVLDVVVETDGKVVDVRVLESPDPSLAQAAVDAARQWTFEPARNAKGVPVKVLYAVTIKFALQ